MYYYDICVKSLNELIHGEKNIDFYVDQYKKVCGEALESCNKVVFCGTLPFVEEYVKYLSSFKECYFFDNCESEGMFLQCPIVSVTDIKYKFDDKTLFIILSRSGVEFYNLIINTLHPDANMLYYTTVELAYPEYFNKQSRYDYSVVGNLEQLKYIIDHAIDLMEIINGFADSQSKEIFARIIMFRLTGDMRVNHNIKTKYEDYLDEDITSFKKFEIVADLGGYIGDTLYDFDRYFKKHGIQYQYHLFEPSEKNYQEAKAVFCEKNIKCYNVCVGNENKQVSLLGGVGSTVTVGTEIQGSEKIEMVRLDDCLDKVTYIKMDIEGSEELALSGMTHLIRKCHPKLAVCIYHKYDDIVKLIKYVERLTSDVPYQYYVRAQRESVVTEMVLYAIPKEIG